MTNQNNGQSANQVSEIEQARSLFESIAGSLHKMLTTMDDGDEVTLKKVPQKTAELQEALTRLNKMKDKFDEQYRTGPKDGELDLDVARFELGCKLARVRSVCEDERVSGCPHGE